VSDRDDSALRRLADRMGIIPEYRDQTGRETRTTSDDTRRALLHAMGVDASSDTAAENALAALDADDEKILIAPVAVRGTTDVLRVRAPASRASSGPWRLEIEREDGERIVSEGPWRGGADLEIELPPLPIGYHTLRIELSAGGDQWRADQRRIVVPPRCVVPHEILGDRRAFGLTANLYTLRSQHNWGVGDFGDLSVLAEWAGAIGADFVGVNPLHALINRGTFVSPYSPVSRLFRNPLYIDVMCVPELRDAPEVRSRILSDEVQARLAELRETPHVQYEQAMAVKGLVLDALHHVFAERVRDADGERARAYHRFAAANEPALTSFATWMTIAEREGPNWREWPDTFRDPASTAVRELASQHADRVEYHRWLQFETDRQLGEAAAAAQRSGMAIGLYQDLAIGTSPVGADTWMYPDLFVGGVSIGAPPDPYSATGQNWGLPPLDPRALRRDGYRYFIDLVRSGLRHAGALRIDHVMGLFRLFWIPEGKSGADGAYVRYPSDDLLGIIALESARHRALIVGEDLGTVPEDVPPALERFGILSSKVLYFERGHDGSFNPSRNYAEQSLATANTHDMPTLASFWQAHDADVRLAAGLIDEAEAESERARRDDDRRALLHRLADEGIIPAERAPERLGELRGAVHDFLGRTPSWLVGLSLDDIAGEIEPVNVPGVGPDKYSSWTRKMRDPLEVIVANPETEAALRCGGRKRAAC
jgi:4-alpha-glucanotransferase